MRLMFLFVTAPYEWRPTEKSIYRVHVKMHCSCIVESMEEGISSMSENVCWLCMHMRYANLSFTVHLPRGQISKYYKILMIVFVR